MDEMKTLTIGGKQYEVVDAVARLAIGSPLVAETAASMTDTSKIYVYTGSETGYETGHWYYYDGLDWADGGVYNSAGINTDTTLTESGVAADAKATGDRIAGLIDDSEASASKVYSSNKVNSLNVDLNNMLKARVSDLSSTYTNAFNEYQLLNADIKLVNNEIVGSNTSFGDLEAIPVDCETGIYTLSFDYYTEQNIGSSSRGMSFVINYSDNSTDSVDLSNTNASFVHASFTSDSGKQIVSIKPTLRNYAGNIFHIKNIMLAFSNSEQDYVPYLIANDRNARDRITTIEGKLNNVMINYCNKENYYSDRTIGNTGNVSTSVGSAYMYSLVKPKAGIYCCFSNGIPMNDKVKVVLYKQMPLNSTNFISQKAAGGNFSAFEITVAESTQCNCIAVVIRGDKLDEGETAAVIKETLMLICLDDVKPNVPYSTYGKTLSSIKNENYLNSIKKYHANWYFDNKFQCVAYSGSKGGYPSNTKEAYEAYALDDFDGIKGDVRVTSDNKLVMCHDEGFTFDGNGRITTYDRDNSTKIIDMTYSEIMELEYAQKPEEGDYAKVAVPEDLIRICKKYGKIAYITIRTDKIETVVAPTICNLLKKYGIIGNAIINCTNLDPLFAVRNLDDDIALSYVPPYDVLNTDTINVYIAKALGNCFCTFYIADGYSMTEQELSGKIAARSDIISLCDTLGVRKAIAIIGNSDCINVAFENSFAMAQTTVKLT